MSRNNDQVAPLMTFTAPTGRTYFDRYGKLQTAGENEIREEYDPLTGAYLGMLIEQSATNLYPYSSNFSKWESIQSNGLAPKILSKSDESIITGGSASRIRFELTGEGYSLKQYTLINGGEVTFSIYAKLVDGSTDTLVVYRDSPGDLNNSVTAKLSKEKWTRIVLKGSDTRNQKFGLYSQLGSAPGDWLEVIIDAAQLETGTVASSYTPTNGSPVTRARDDAQFTDPTVFNNFERGAFVINVQNDAATGCILATSESATQSRILAFAKESGWFYKDNRDSATYISQNTAAKKIAVSFSSSSLKYCVDGYLTEYPFPGWDENEGLIIGRERDGWAGKIFDIQFYPEPLTADQMRRLTTHDATTVISDCPDGGYYDYSDLSTLFIESDASGIEIEDRTPARVGDPVGAILDKSGHGNHMTASTNDRRGFLRTDGERYWIERSGRESFGFNFSYEYSFTLFSGLSVDTKNFIILTGTDGAGGDNYTTAYQNSTNTKVFSGLGLSQQRAFFDGALRRLETRKQALDAIADPVLIREFYQASNRNGRIYHGGHPNYEITGNDYGFAWATRLSEDDAQIVERDMRRNMPELP